MSEGYEIFRDPCVKRLSIGTRLIFDEGLFPVTLIGPCNSIALALDGFR